MRIARQLWNDELGVVLSAELVLVITILVLGLIVGLGTLRDQVVQELGDLAAAISDLNQSYSIGGISAHHSSTAGFAYDDLLDDCDGPGDPPGGDAGEPACIQVCDIDASDEA